MLYWCTFIPYKYVRLSFLLDFIVITPNSEQIFRCSMPKQTYYAWLCDWEWQIPHKIELIGTPIQYIPFSICRFLVLVWIVLKRRAKLNKYDFQIYLVLVSVFQRKYSNGEKIQILRKSVLCYHSPDYHVFWLFYLWSVKAKIFNYSFISSSLPMEFIILIIIISYHQ